jgi:hypothetical protein
MVAIANISSAASRLADASPTGVCTWLPALQRAAFGAHPVPRVDFVKIMAAEPWRGSIVTRMRTMNTLA